MSGAGAGAADAGTAVVLPALGAVLQAAPSPSDGGELNSVTVSPGLPGFFAAFVLAVLVVLLAVDMTRRVRRVQAKARVEERYAELEREEAARRAAEEPGSDGSGAGEDRAEASADDALAAQDRGDGVPPAPEGSSTDGSSTGDSNTEVSAAEGSADEDPADGGGADEPDDSAPGPDGRR